HRSGLLLTSRPDHTQRTTVADNGPPLPPPPPPAVLEPHPTPSAAVDVVRDPPLPVVRDVVVRAVADAEHGGQLKSAGDADVRGDLVGAVLITGLAQACLKQQRQHPLGASARHVRELYACAPVVQVDVDAGVD